MYTNDNIQMDNKSIHVYMLVQSNLVLAKISNI